MERFKVLLCLAFEVGHFYTDLCDILLISHVLPTIQLIKLQLFIVGYLIYIKCCKLVVKES